jgi:hypothetical protein
MAKKGRTGSPQDPSQMLRPEVFLHFVETDEFRDDWSKLKLDVETDLLAVQVAIMISPELYPVIQGTGGLRKARFSPEDSDGGKSGAIRVCYAYFKEHWTVFLVMAYVKGEKDNLSAEEKRYIKKYLEIIEDFLSKSRR